MNHRRDIDGLRAVAVIPVILFHAGLDVFGGGYVGVDVFFVISGFLITSLLIGELEGGDFSILRFYERRVRRILPALFAVMFACVPFAWLWMLPEQFESFARSLIAVVLFVSNVLFLREEGYFAAAAELKPLLHTWSLAVEEQYYLLFPPLLWLIWRGGRRHAFWAVAGLAALSLVYSEWQSRNDPSANFYLATTRAWELLAGSLCAFLSVDRARRSNDALAASGLLLILFSVFAYDSETPFPGLHALAPVGGTALILLYAGPRTVVARILSCAPLVGIGLVSYSAYLWHQPLFAFARLRSITEPGAPLMLGLAAASIALACLTWRFVEQPFRRRSPGLLSRRRNLFLAAGTTGVVLACIGAYGTASDGMIARASSIPAWIVDAGDDKNDASVCLRDHATFDVELALRACSAGAADDPLVVLVGDSHADHYAAALREGAARTGFRFVQLTVNSCLPFAGLRSVERDCTEYAARTGDALDRLRPDLVIVAARWTIYLANARFDNGEGGVETGPLDPFVLEGARPGTSLYRNRLLDIFREGIAGLSARGGHVLLIHPSPEAGWDVPQTFGKMVRFGGDRAADIVISTEYRRYLERNATANAFLDGLEGETISGYGSADILCDTRLPGRCLNAMDGRILYHDDDHFSKTGAMYLQDSLLAAVTAALGT